MARKSKTQIALCVLGLAVVTFGTTMIEKQLYKLNFNFNFSLIILNLVEIIIFGIKIPLSFRKLNFSNFEANKDALKKLRFFF